MRSLGPTGYGLSPHRGKKRSDFHKTQRRAEMWEAVGKSLRAQGRGRPQERHIELLLWVLKVGGGAGVGQAEVGQGAPNTWLTSRDFESWQEAHGSAWGGVHCWCSHCWHGLLGELQRQVTQCHCPSRLHVWISPSIHGKTLKLMIRAYSCIYLWCARHCFKYFTCI